MAIDRVKKIYLLAPTEQVDDLMARLHRLRAVHLVDASAELEAKERFKRGQKFDPDADSRVKQSAYILEQFEKFAPRPRAFAENFVSVPLMVTPDRVEEVRQSVVLDELYPEVQQLAVEHAELTTRREALSQRLSELQPLADLPFEPAQLQRLKYVTVRVGTAAAGNWTRLTSDPKAGELLVWETAPLPRGRLRVVVAYLASDKDEAEPLLKSAGFAPLVVPELDKPAAEEMADIEEQIRKIDAKRSELARRIAKLAELREDVQILNAYWVNELEKSEAHRNLLASPRISIITGYVRVRDLARLEHAVTKEFPSASLLTEDPSPEDNVPVSITLNGFFRPMQLLINMFGLPDYFGFDPTPYLTISFLVFFGICFGDVIYGLMLVCFAAYLMRKARRYPGLRNFCAFFVYAGVSTMIVGALTGAWASNLADPQYLGENNLLYRIRSVFFKFDPMTNTVVALLIALGIGMTNQLYGIVLGLYQSLRRRDFVAAVFDYGSWLLVLPGFAITAGRLFVPVPPWLASFGLAIFGVGAVMLILSQGRHEKGLIVKAITGVISLYGILGTYGCTSFVGDVLSYSRLLALGLTTTIVGMAFNIIAGLLKDVSYVGGVLFALVIVFGHTFNFAINILGAFVHSARLIFLEFFGRFYQGGATRFQPFGFGTENVQLLET